MQEKNELRIKAKEIRKSLDMKSISEKIVENIFNLKEYKKAKNILFFYPLEHEVDLLGLMINSDKNFYLPRVVGKEMEICPYVIGDELSESKFKTKEPICEPINPEVLDLIFVPALMVDKHLHRLGYGGGFYDRFLSKHAKSATKIAAISSALVVDELPSEDFDARIDLVVNE